MGLLDTELFYVTYVMNQPKIPANKLQHYFGYQMAALSDTIFLSINLDSDTVDLYY